MQDDPIQLCRHGRISPAVALARLLLAGVDPHTSGAQASDLPALQALLHDRAAVLADLAAIGRDSDHAGPTDPGRIAAFFDRAVDRQPEASVAFYCLGDPALLDAATAEIVDWLRAQRLIGPDTALLDLGCGIGRVAQTVAPLCRSVIGLDIAPRMIEQATARCAGMPNIRCMLGNGRDLYGIESRSLNLVLAVDAFPYIVQLGADAARRHLAEAARVLRSGGTLALLNLSYGPETIADLVDWMPPDQFHVRCAGERPFQIWDATAFILERR